MYTGEVSVGGASQTRDLGALTMTKVAVGDYNNNSYLLTCRSTGTTCLIDAAAEPETLLALLPDRRLDMVLTTHRHPDHWQALATVVAETHATTFASEIDAASIPVTTDAFVAEGQMIQIGDVQIQANLLTGHTESSVVLQTQDGDGRWHIWTGDCLFPGGIGKTANSEDFSTLLAGVRSKIFDQYPDDAVIYPGHGHDTTLGNERPHLQEWLERGW